MASSASSEAESDGKIVASNIDFGGNFDFLDKILESDDNYKLLESIFLAKGRGRRRSIPQIQATNRLFLQLGLLRRRHQRSWDDLTGWMKLLFKNYPSSKSRYLIEKIAKASLAHLADPDDFLDETVDLHFIGPLCQEAGITRTSFLNPVDPHEHHITREMLLEMSTAYGAEVFSSVNHIYPNRYSLKRINSELKNTRTKYKKLNKSRSRDNAAVEYLEEKIAFDEDVEVKEKSDQIPMKSASKKQSETISKLQKEKQKLLSTSTDQEQKLSNLNEKVNVLSNDSKRKSRRISEVEVQVEAQTKKLKEKENEINRLQEELANTRMALQATKREVRSLKSRSHYQSCRKRASYLRKREVELSQREQEYDKYHPKLKKHVHK